MNLKIKAMIYTETKNKQLYVYINGKLIYKKWLSTNTAILFNNPPTWIHDKIKAMDKLTNKSGLIIKNKIIKCLTEDFKNNQAIFNKKEGYQVFDGTDLEMVVDCVIKGIKFAQSEINDKE